METVIAKIVVGIVEAVVLVGLFGWIWKKKVTPLREAAETVVKAVAAEGAVAVAAKTKELLADKPQVKAVLDKVIAIAHAKVDVKN